VHVENTADVRSPEDNTVSGTIEFETKARNLKHVKDSSGNQMPDTRDTEVRTRSKCEVTYYMYAYPNNHNYDSNFLNSNYVESYVFTYTNVLHSDPNRTSFTSFNELYSTQVGCRNPYSEKSRTGATYYTATVIEYNVLTGEMGTLPSLQQGEPFPDHPIPN
jgi:hypothetical protein